MDGPPEPGRSFASGQWMWTWRERSTVTVPVGTFSDCHTLAGSGPKGRILEKTACRGMGYVKAQGFEGDRYTSVLAEKNW